MYFLLFCQIGDMEFSEYFFQSETMESIKSGPGQFMAFDALYKWVIVISPGKSKRTPIDL